MDKKADLGTTIFFQEKMEIALASELDREDRYMTRLIKEEKWNKTQFRRYSIFTLILGWITFGLFVIMNAISRFKDVSEDFEKIINQDNRLPDLVEDSLTILPDFGLVIYLFAAIFFAFTLIGLVFCTFKLIYYARRKNKEKDNRDGVWRTYEEMTELSRQRHEKLALEHTKTLTQLNANREIQLNMVQQQLQGDIVGPEETISMDELKQAKLEEKPQEEQATGNPLKKTW